MAPKVLLSTTMRWPSTARLAGAFAQLGCTVHALCPKDAPAGASRYAAVRHRYDPFFPRASLRSAIAAAQPDLVIPCDDRALAHLLKLHDWSDGRDVALSGLIFRSLGNPKIYPRLISRSIFIGVVRQTGIRAPETIEVATPAALETALDALGLPAVLKADGSWGGDGVMLERTRGDAREAFQRLSTPPSRLRSLVRALRRDVHFARDVVHKPRPVISVQRFVSGKAATASFACWQGEVVAAIHLDVLVSQGATGPACVVERVDCPEMQRAAATLAHKFHLSGLHGLDFIRDASGAAHLIEINPRATQTSYLALGEGHDLPAALIAALRGSKAIARPAATEQGMIALFPQEWTRDPASAYLKTAYHDVPHDDPAILPAALQFQR